MTSKPQPSGGTQPGVGDTAGELLTKGADKAIEAGLSGWWKRRSETEKVATGLISFGLAIGPLGMGLLGALGALYKSAIPNTQQVEAVWWLLIITAPLAVFVLVVTWAAGKAGPIPAVLGAAAVAAVLASGMLSQSSVPNELAGMYCYAEVGGSGVVYEDACRAFDHAGFVAENQPRANPSGSLAVFGSAVAYTAEARGTIMMVASIMVFLGIGLLLRERT